MSSKTPKTIIVDTNCFVRLYMSPVRPLLGVVVGGVKLMTLPELRLETANNTNVRNRHPWMGAADIQNDIAKACLTFREPKTTRIAKATAATKTLGNKLLAQYCKENRTLVTRELSLADARALAAADVLQAGLATDEWPLRHVANHMGFSGEDELYMSIEILHLLEEAGSLTKIDRMTTVRTWVQQEDGLPRNWQARYLELFGEAPPDGQSDNSESA